MRKDNIKKYMKGVHQFLIEKYGEVKPEWGCTLTCLENTLRRYNQVKETLDEVGIFDTTTGKKNALLTTEKDCIATILKISQKLGINPWDDSKIKAEVEEDDEDFIEGLTSE